MAIIVSQTSVYIRTVIDDFKREPETEVAMFRHPFLTLSILLLSVAAQARLDVHEWGTFTSLVGSNGVARDGMFEEDEVLPDFVHNFGDQIAQIPRPEPRPEPQPTPLPDHCRRTKIPCDFLVDQVVTQKMETPVVYFYSDQSRNVTFDVSFPAGIISQTFPAASRMLPQAIPGVPLRNGYARYDVEILKDSAQQPPVVPAGNIYGHARNVSADLIRVGNETEKFIFYRGLGKFDPLLRVMSANDGLRLSNNGRQVIPRAFVVYTQPGVGGSILPLKSIAAGRAVDVNAKTIGSLRAARQTTREFIATARALLVEALEQEGLFRDEANAMVNTWEHGYLQTPGLRVLYVLSRPEVDAILPARVSPQPDSFERAFIGRIEVLTDLEETRLLSEILAARDLFDVTRLGRMTGPVLSRIEELARDRGLMTADLRAVFNRLNAKAGH